MHPSWQSFLDSQKSEKYFAALKTFLDKEYESKQILPEKSKIFSAFSTDLNEIKVVILGQDPYHTPGVPHGLAFSVEKTAKIPPSLKNIYKEIDADLGAHANPDGNLESWQSQGVFLLNAVLTVEAHRPTSHKGKGWEIFTDATLKYLNDTKQNLVFILWGSYAKEKSKFIDKTKHLVLESAHPSPLSARNGFFGSRPFSKTNSYLKLHGKSEIIW